MYIILEKIVYIRYLSIK